MKTTFIDSLSNKTELDIFTNIELGQEGHWFYQIFSEYDRKRCFILGHSGKATICECRYCLKQKVDILEYYSIYLALERIKDFAPFNSLCFWISSDRILFDDGIWFTALDNSKCSFLKDLEDNLNKLLSELAVKNINYKFSNQYMIYPHYEANKDKSNLK
jgi:hypothetical protein